MTEISKGLCQCGCGQRTRLAAYTDRRRGDVRGEPVRFVHGHNRAKGPIEYLGEESGLCACGCGGRTAIAKQSSSEFGWVKGRPKRYIRGHANRGRTRPGGGLTGPPREPYRGDGLCKCGCGKPTKIAKATNSQDGSVVGWPRNYLRGHGMRAAAAKRPDFSEEMYRVEDRGYSTPCWIWAKSLDRRGYGQWTRRRKTRRAHHVAWEAAGRQPLARGFDMHHECGVRECVNPDHLTVIEHDAHSRLHQAQTKRRAS